MTSINSIYYRSDAIAFIFFYFIKTLNVLSPIFTIAISPFRRLVLILMAEEEAIVDPISCPEML